MFRRLIHVFVVLLLIVKRLPADCFACMRCSRVCSTDAIHFCPDGGPLSSPANEASDKAVSS